MRPCKESMSEVTGMRKTLAEKLYSIYADYEFVFGVLADLKSDDECRIMLDYIANNPEADDPELIILGLTIASERA